MVGGRRGQAVVGGSMLIECSEHGCGGCLLPVYCTQERQRGPHVVRSKEQKRNGERAWQSAQLVLLSRKRRRKSRWAWPGACAC